MNMLPLQKKMVCSETYHSDYNRNYIRETLPALCASPWRLFGKKCFGCNKAFVSKKKGMDGATQFFPSSTCPIHYCAQLGVGDSTCDLAYCHGCFCERQSQCGLTPNSPRKKRRVERPISYSL